MFEHLPNSTIAPHESQVTGFFTMVVTYSPYVAG